MRARPADAACLWACPCCLASRAWMAAAAPSSLAPGAAAAPSPSSPGSSPPLPPENCCTQEEPALRHTLQTAHWQSEACVRPRRLAAGDGGCWQARGVVSRRKGRPGDSAAWCRACTCRTGTRQGHHLSLTILTVLPLLLLALLLLLLLLPGGGGGAGLGGRGDGQPPLPQPLLRCGFTQQGRRAHGWSQSQAGAGDPWAQCACHAQAGPVLHDQLLEKYNATCHATQCLNWTAPRTSSDKPCVPSPRSTRMAQRQPRHVARPLPLTNSGHRKVEGRGRVGSWGRGMLIVCMPRQVRARHMRLPASLTCNRDAAAVWHDHHARCHVVPPMLRANHDHRRLGGRPLLLGTAAACRGAARLRGAARGGSAAPAGAGSLCLIAILDGPQGLGV